MLSPQLLGLLRLSWRAGKRGQRPAAARLVVSWDHKYGTYIRV